MNASSVDEADKVSKVLSQSGRKPKATPDRVSEAIKTLKARKEDLTAVAVQSLTGGSFTTVCRVMRELVENQAAISAATPLPEGLVKALKAYSDTSVAGVTEEWRLRFDELRALCMTLEKSATQLEEDNEGLHDEVERLRGERDQQAGRCALLHEELTAVKHEIAALQNQLVAAHLHAARSDDERDAAIDRLQREELRCIRANEQLEQNSEVVTTMRVELATTKAHLEHALQRTKERESGGVQPSAKQLAATSLEHNIEAVKASLRTGIDPVPMSNDDDDIGPP